MIRWVLYPEWGSFPAFFLRSWCRSSWKTFQNMQIPWVDLNCHMWKEAVKHTVCHHDVLWTSSRAFTSLSSLRSTINILWLSNMEILVVFCRVGMVTMPIERDVSCPHLGTFTLLALHSSLLHLLLRYVSCFFLFLPFSLYLHAFSHSVLWAQGFFSRGTVISLFSSLYRSLLFYELPRYKFTLTFFLVWVFTDKALPLCLR